MHRAHCFLFSFVTFILQHAALYADGPGFPNVPQVAGSHLAGPLIPLQGRVAVIVYDGLFITNIESASALGGADLLSRSWDLSDLSNIRSRVIQFMTPNSAVAAHGYWQEGPYTRGLAGGDVQVVGSGSAATVERVDLSALPMYYAHGETSWPGRGLTFQPWVVPMFWSYGDNNFPAFLYKSNQRLARWDHIAQTGVVGHPFLVGNLLIYASEQTRTGIAVYDITPSLNSPDTQPRLLGVMKDRVGGYWPEIFGNGNRLYIVFPGDNGNEATRFQVVDITDPANMQVVADRRLSGQTNYIQFQDDYAFAGSFKIRMPTGEVARTFDQTYEMSQFTLPVGNLLVGGGNSLQGGLNVFAHQAAPDTVGPYVGYHVPRNDQTNYPVAAPISLLIHETLLSRTIVNKSTFFVYPLDAQGNRGTPIDGRLAFSFNDILTFTPSTDLRSATTYEVVLPAGGIKDAAGNGMQPYSFRFSTGGQLAAGNDPPVIESFTYAPIPAVINQPVQFMFSAKDPENSAVSYRVSFGDLTADSEWASSGSASHVYTKKGHYEALLKARDTAGATSVRRIVVTVRDPGSERAESTPPPSNSSTIAFDAQRRVAWSVNPDNDSIAKIDSESRLEEIPLGSRCSPRNVAVDRQGRAWVSCHQSDEVVVVSPAGAVVSRLKLRYGAAPFGVAAAPDGSYVLVTLYGTGDLVRYSTATLTEVSRVALGPTARAIAITSAGNRALVTRFISPDNGGQVWDVSVSAAALTKTRTIVLKEDWLSVNGANKARGLPNYLAGVTLSPLSDRAYVAAKQDNINLGYFVNGASASPDTTVRAILSQIGLAEGAELQRLDIDNSASPNSVTFSDLGDYGFLTLEGNNVVALFDAFNFPAPALAQQNLVMVQRIGTGNAPQGAAMDGAGGKLLVQDFLSRQVTEIDLRGFFAEAGAIPTRRIPTVVTERLPANVLRGKQIFYNASDKGGQNGGNRMSGEGYIACATCHIDGGHDGRTWDFTQRGEGLRNTSDLRGRFGTGMGRLHWSGNFDEVQDFEGDIRKHFGGAGFLSLNDFQMTADPLGVPKRGKNDDLDALAAYVSSLGPDTIPRSPYRNSDGSMTEKAQRGQTLFESQGCRACHAGVLLTDSSVTSPILHDVGTQATSSGKRLGQPLPGIDTPTLYGIWSTEPFFHDGNAKSLTEVFSRGGGVLLRGESAVFSGPDTQAYQAIYGGNFRNGAIGLAGSPGGAVTFQNVDGGKGGPARLEVRYSMLYGSGSIDVIVNGATANHAFSMTDNNPGWWPSGFEVKLIDTTLNAGATNTIRFQYKDRPFAIDDVRVTNADVKDRMAPHAKVAALTAAERDDLIRFLRELDQFSLPRPANPLGLRLVRSGADPAP